MESCNYQPTKRARRWHEGLCRAILWARDGLCELGHTAAVICTRLPQLWPYQQSVMEGVWLVGLYPTLLSYWLLVDKGKSVFCCISTTEPTRIQWIAPNPRSHRQPCLNMVVCKTKPINVCEKEICREGGERSRVGRWENMCEIVNEQI